MYNTRIKINLKYLENNDIESLIIVQKEYYEKLKIKIYYDNIKEGKVINPLI